MIEHLAVFGDSTTGGSELKPEDKCYGELLAEKLDAKSFSNFGTPAAGPQHLVIQFKNFLRSIPAERQQQYLAVFWIGGYDRSMSYYDKEWIFITPNGGFSTTVKNREYADMANEQYFKYLHSEELSTFNLNTSLITLQSMCKTHSVHDYYLPGWQSLPLWEEVNLDKVYDKGKSSFYDLFRLKDKIQYVEKNRNNMYIKPNLTHPNQLGHCLIADTAYEFISNTIDNTI